MTSLAVASTVPEMNPNAESRAQPAAIDRRINGQESVRRTFMGWTWICCLLLSALAVSPLVGQDGPQGGDFQGDDFQGGDVQGGEPVNFNPPPRNLYRDHKGELLVAIETRDHAAARAAIVDGANVGINIGEPSPLATSALLNDLRMVLILMKAGAHPNATSDSPLAEAIRSDNQEMVDLFLQVGAEIPGQSTAEELFDSAQGGDNAEWFYDVLIDRGCDPQLGLQAAVVNIRPPLVALSLRRGATWQALPPGSELLEGLPTERLTKIFQGLLDTSLGEALPQQAVLDYFFDIASRTGDRLLVDDLVDHGGEVTLRHAEDAMEAGQQDLALHFLDVLGGPDTLGSGGEAAANLPLVKAHLEDHQAAKTASLVKAALAFGIPALLVLVGLPMVLRRGQRSPAAFHKVVEEGNVAKASRLLDRGVDVTCLHQGQRPLHVAAANGHLTLVRMLLSRGARADQRAGDESGYTALHIAASLGRKEVVETLLKSRCPVDVRATNGQTALYSAASGGQRDMVQWLIEQGADIEKTVREGETPLMHAIAHRDVEAVSALLASGANANPSVPTKPLHRVAISGQAGMARLLLEHGADVNAMDANGATPLQIALHHHQVEVGDILRKAGGRLT